MSSAQLWWTLSFPRGATDALVTGSVGSEYIEFLQELHIHQFVDWEFATASFPYLLTLSHPVCAACGL